MGARADARRADARLRLPGKHLRSLWISTLFVALLALTWQSLTLQTHVHAWPDGGVTGLTGNAASPARPETGHPAPDVPTPCPMCQEMAHSGSYLLPSLPAFHLPHDIVSWHIVIPAQTIAPRQRSHTWQSRAPPYQLQA
jgi:hypothetical protein